MRKTLLLCITIILFSAGNLLASEAVIEPQTAAATGFVILKSKDVPATLELVGPIGAEEITLERYVSGDFDDTGTWETWELDGSTVTGLTTTNHAITLYGPVMLRINKPDTGANAVGVILRK